MSLQSGLDKLSPASSEKQRLYSEPRIRELLRLIIVSGKRVEPSIGQDGKIHWEAVEKVIPSSELNVKSLLEHLAEAGILKKVPFKNYILCPQDERADALPQLTCPKCGKTTLVKTSLLSHNLCGYIGDRSKFASTETGKMMCPKCNREIKTENDLKLVGIWFECTTCGARTNTPNVIFLCKEGHQFKITDLILETFYAYEVPHDVISELRVKEILGPSLKELLVSLRFVVEQPGKVTGRSGASHTFDVYAKKGNEDISIEVAIDSKPIEITPLITYFAKTFDTGIKHPVMVAVPDINEQVAMLSKTYNIKVITDPDGTGVSEKIRNYIAELGLA